MVAVELGGRLERRDIRSALGLRHRQRSDPLARPGRRQVFGFQLIRAVERNRPGAEALHDKAEIGEPEIVAEDFAAEGNGTDIERLVRAAIGRRNRQFQPAGLAQHPDQAPADVVDIRFAVHLVLHRADIGFCPGAKLRRQLPVAIVEERPVEIGRIRHQLPSKTGFSRATKAW